MGGQLLSAGGGWAGLKSYDSHVTKTDLYKKKKSTHFMYSTTGRRRKTGIITRKMAGDSHTTTRRKEPLKHVSLIAHSFGFTVASSLSGAARTAVYSCRQTPHCTARDHGGVVNTGQPRHTRVPGLLYPVSAIPRNLV